MADEEHVRILKQGVEAWNMWRRAHPDVQPDLRGTYLAKVDLSRKNIGPPIGVNLSKAEFHLADLHEALLTEADLSGAGLSSVNLAGADLSDANLRDARLWDANLEGSNLIRANLDGAILREVD